MIATVLDTVTGKTKIVDGPRSWEWAENNWSCDCNRGNPENTNDNCESKRYLVIHAEMNSSDDYPYTLQELNEYYPKQLLEQYLPKL